MATGQFGSPSSVGLHGTRVHGARGYLGLTGACDADNHGHERQKQGRGDLSDEQWRLIEGLIPGQGRDGRWTATTAPADSGWPQKCRSYLLRPALPEFGL